MRMLVGFLRWHDLDPRDRPFDERPAREATEKLVSRWVATRPRRDPDDHDGNDELEDAIDRALVEKYGAWAAGWNWAATEPGGGGPVRGWCCSRDSLLRPEDPSPKTSVDRVVAALGDWRSYLGELSDLFATLRDENAGLPLEAGVERAAARLLPLVLERTEASDAWYWTFKHALTWYLESTGCEKKLVEAAIAPVVSGRFSSWCAPDPEYARTVCTELGHVLSERLREIDPLRDATAAWLKARAAINYTSSTDSAWEPAAVDGHLRYIEGPERRRDPVRSERMARALEASRASARRSEPLDWNALAAWHALVLGVDSVSFRSSDAYAKIGRERYPFAPNLKARFEAALAEANDPKAPVALRAARAYLDVCFFHPFDDGNGRAARLALDHVLLREGLALRRAEPIFLIGRAADDPRGAFCLVWVVNHLMGPMPNTS
jgi:hypothetical protein